MIAAWLLGLPMAAVLARLAARRPQRGALILAVAGGLLLVGATVLLVLALSGGPASAAGVSAGAAAWLADRLSQRPDRHPRWPGTAVGEGNGESRHARRLAMAEVAQQVVDGRQPNQRDNREVPHNIAAALLRCRSGPDRSVPAWPLRPDPAAIALPQRSRPDRRLWRSGL